MRRSFIESAIIPLKKDNSNATRENDFILLYFFLKKIGYFIEARESINFYWKVYGGGYLLVMKFG